MDARALRKNSGWLVGVIFAIAIPLCLSPLGREFFVLIFKSYINNDATAQKTLHIMIERVSNHPSNALFLLDINRTIYLFALTFGLIVLLHKLSNYKNRE